MTKPPKKDGNEHYLVRQRFDGDTFKPVDVECACGEKFKTKGEFVEHKNEQTGS
jgi:hypothetical protein